MSDTNRMRFHVYLDTGAVLDFTADDMKTAVNRMTGKLQEVEWFNLSGNAPRYVDADRIVAITREIEGLA